MRSMIRVAKAVRSWPPCNRILTGGARALASTLDVDVGPLARHLQRVGEVRRALPNGRVLRLWSRGDDWIANEIFWRGPFGYEPETSRLFFELARGAEAVLDVGAHVGYYSILAALAAHDVQVYAFEPHPVVFERLRRNVQVNRLSNVEPLRIAVADRSGSATFYHGRADLPSSSSLSPEFMRASVERADMRSTSVPVTSIDDFVRDRGIRRVGLIKIDTESTEPDVLSGMRSTLARDRPTIVCEVLRGWDVERRLEAILRPLGYAFYLLTTNGPQRVERIAGHDRYLNQLFAPASAHLP